MRSGPRNNAVPFYLPETIGRSGIDNEPTLHAFKVAHLAKKA